MPCRFLKVLGICPYADACVYCHTELAASERFGQFSKVEDEKEVRSQADLEADGTIKIGDETGVLEAEGDDAEVRDSAPTANDQMIADLLSDFLNTGPSAPTAARPMKAVGRAGSARAGKVVKGGPRGGDARGAGGGLRDAPKPGRGLSSQHSTDSDNSYSSSQVNSRRPRH